MTTNTENNTETANVGTNETANQPVAKLRIGLITASIWQRVLPEGTFYAASFERCYRDKEGHWHTPPSFNTEELLALSKLTDQAHSRILELRGNQTD
jgi:hypothetical protein